MNLFNQKYIRYNFEEKVRGRGHVFVLQAISSGSTTLQTGVGTHAMYDADQCRSGRRYVS